MILDTYQLYLYTSSKLVNYLDITLDESNKQYMNNKFTYKNLFWLLSVANYQISTRCWFCWPSRSMCTPIIQPSYILSLCDAETSETEITTTEIIKRRDVGPYGIRSEYCIRKIICPLGVPETPRGGGVHGLRCSMLMELLLPSNRKTNVFSLEHKYDDISVFSKCTDEQTVIESKND